MTKYTPAQAKAVKKYLSKFADIKIRVSKEDKARYEAAAEKAKLSLNKFVISAIEEKTSKINDELL